jgi:Nucleotidyltransferase domain
MADPKSTAHKLTTELEKAAAGALRSVVLYGSVARNEAVPGVSDINLLVLLDRANPVELGHLAPLVRRWAQAGNTAPLLLSWNEWRDGADAFAIEAADMRDAHQVLAGADPISGLEVHGAALRLQAERELRGKLIQLRTGMMLVAHRPSDIGRLLLTALPSFTTYLRAALRLGEGAAPAATANVIERGCRLVGAAPEALARCWDARKSGRGLKCALDDPLVAHYYEIAEKTVAYVDAFPQEKLA